MTRPSRLEYLRSLQPRYQEALKPARRAMLDEFCQVTGYHRKYALRLLNGPPVSPRPRRRPNRPVTYPDDVIRVLRAIWEAAGYPWSARLKALLPLWLPWARGRFRLSGPLEQQLLRISPRQIDRRLQPHKRSLKKRLYGRTKPGSLLKHHIPLRTDRWNTTRPGFAEVDLVSRSGTWGDGEFAHSFNLTDIHTTWVETRAVLGKSQLRMQQALDEMRRALPFRLRGIDSDNGSEFINRQLYGYCRQRKIQFTRGRPYKKDDNAHIEQKNWTHVRKLLGYDRYDSAAAVEAINRLYAGDLRLLQNLFLPSVKLLRKERLGSRVRRRYGPPQTPLDRVLACRGEDPQALASLLTLRQQLDPFQLATSVERQLQAIDRLANPRHSPKAGEPPPVIAWETERRFRRLRGLS